MTNQTQIIQENIFYSMLKTNSTYLDENTEVFYTQVSVVAILTATLILGLIVYSI